MNQKNRTAEATLRLEPVLTMSRITSLMELAATRLVHQELRGAQSSVGVAMDVTHASPALAAGSLIGGSVRAVASLCGVEGKVYRVAVDAFDESGLIASAEHTRVLVDGRVGRALPAVPLEA